MNLSLTRYVGFAAAVAALSLTALAPAANAQYTTLVTDGGQSQLNNTAFPSGAINTTPGATNVYIAELLSSFDSGLVNSERVTGTLASRVFRNTNGQLDFFYQVFVSSVTSGVTATNLTDFSLFTAASAFSTTSDIDGAGSFVTGGVRPFGSQKTSDGIVAFAFNSNPRTQGNDQSAIGDGTIKSGQSSAVLSVRTNTTLFRTSNGTVNGGAAANAAILSPTLVPEAGTLALLLPAFALGAVAVIRRKK